ncbi:M20/M25/M40 family metallo-hydrolase [Congregibacter variabilis]|uniref:M20/M25/M40 family metallo-hydrolase n=1 Tax=Congregibacter variabilis TaxID=3081200 RepID=A0ABZ0I5Z8_9GAMM|nr:M20/M25/M40 family metallo-hydrolase [Congregibacter sp. IMCC43200]
MRFISLLVFLFSILATATSSATPSAMHPSVDLLADWVALDAPSGHEYHATDRLQQQLSGWRKGRSGNLIKVVGDIDGDGPASLVACLLDAPSFTVSQVRADGYLRLHHAGAAPEHPLWTQAHEGQQLRIMTRRGPVVGVSALANGHFSNLHASEVALTRAEDLWLDVGADSAADVAALGIELLDPVTRHLPAWSFGDWVAGPAAGSRVGCAAVVAAAEAGVRGGGATVYVLSTLSHFANQGLSAAIVELGSFDRIVLMDRGVERLAELPPFPRGLREFSPAKLEQIQRLAPTVSAAGSLMERVHRKEVERLGQRLLNALGDDSHSLTWTSAPNPLMPLNNAFASDPGRSDATDVDQYLHLLDDLGELYGVPGSEGPVRAAVSRALPSWAQNALQSDEIGNLWLDLGPSEQPATIFMAHMDEVGWVVEDVAEDGVVSLMRRGGALSLAAEGQPAILHLDHGSGADSEVSPTQLPGVFLSRSAEQVQELKARQPKTLQAWFGLARSELEQMGVTVGMPVTGYKEGHRLANNRFTVRGMDDRVGTAALIQAVRRLDPDTLEQRVVIAWSVQEEGGLFGAAALAARFATNTRRVYSIDTFVTSDTPLEKAHFAYAPLGSGPVLRSMESSGLVMRNELDRNRAVANASGITYQIGMTQGGTDGTAFTFYGVPNAGLSWPGRYSHGPAELGDASDMLRLVDLISAFMHAKP